MNKKITAFLTAVSVLAGVCAPVCADSAEALPTEIVITLSGTDTTDAAEAPEEAESEDIASDAEADEADTSSEPEDSAADTDEEDADAAEETPVAADTAVEADTIEETETENNLVEVVRSDEDGNFLYVDYESETVSDDNYITDEAAYMAASWADWDASTGTLTLKGQLCNTYWSESTSTAYNIAKLSGVDETKVRKIVITRGTMAGTSMAQMFRDMENLTEIEGVKYLDTSIVTDMATLFANCKKLKKVDLSGWDTSNVTKMSAVFNHCESLTSVDLSGWDTSKVTTMKYMFNDCQSLKTITVTSKWNTRSVTQCDDMFTCCTSLVGGAGTEFDRRYTDKTYARMDGGLAHPGYFTVNVSLINAPSKPTVTIKPVFGGRTVEFACSDPDAEIFYNFGSSAIDGSCACARPGETIFLSKPMTGKDAAMYFKAYNGRWSAVGKWGVLNVQLDQPLIRQSGPKSDNKFKVYTQAQSSYIVYTLDGSTPRIDEGSQKLKVTNGRLVWDTTTTVRVNKGQTIKAIAIRNGLVTSEVMTYTNK